MGILIKEGLIVKSEGSYIGDVFVENGVISATGKNLSDKYAGCCSEIINAKGKYILPGAIDPHTHLEMPIMGIFTSDDFYTGTVSAACGGITSIIDFELVPKGVSTEEAFAAKNKIASAKAAVDYGFHASYSEFSDVVKKELPDVIQKYGSPSFKLYTTYAFRVSDKALIQFMIESKKLGGMVQLHSENNAIIETLNEIFSQEGKTSIEFHPRSRPNIAEAEAVSRAIDFVKMTGANLYIVHLSSKEALKRAVEARKAGLSIFIETCPQYLVLNENLYMTHGWDAAKYLISPPLRDAESCEALWKGISGGDIDTIGSDHCPFFLHGMKDLFGKNDYKKIPGGAPGIETTLILLYSEGVRKGRISLEKMVEVTSTNTAKLFGITNKGDISVGKDADIVVFDPNQKYTISYKTLHMNVDYNPYEGKEVTGMPYMVFSRGIKVAQWNKDRVKFLGQAGDGKFIHRRPFKPL